MEKDELLKMLFTEHHRHLSETKQKIQSLTQRVIGIFVLGTGWLILAKESPKNEVRVVLVFVFLLLGVSTILALLRFNKTYRTESGIISKINKSFGLFEKNKYIENDSIYPKSWESFGEESMWFGLGHHVVAILAMCALAIIATYVK